MKVFALLGCVAVSAFSQASFELVLALDTTNRTVHRYDGDTGTYLGNFGNLRIGSGAFAMGVDQARNKVYVGTDEGIKAFNYNTGEFITTIPTAGPSNISTFSNGDLLIQSGAGVWRANSTTGANIVTYNVSAGGQQGSVAAAAVDENDQVFISDSSVSSAANNAKIDRFAGDGTYIGSTGFYTQRLFSFYQQMQARGGNLVIGDDNTGFINTMTYTAGAMGVPSKITNASDMTQVMGVAMGHGDVRYRSGYGPSGASRIIISTATGGPIITFATPQIAANTMRKICVIVAPEPGSLLGLGLGLLVISRRKK
ncbi:MAG: PEP-CTERM sorting domain-containing protein [Armatimonadetes bacterium]|nr:PEP-CTERM sorting domain-containing protein [Armatimonadota bacterium]